MDPEKLTPAEQKTLDAIFEKTHEESRYVGKVKVADDKKKAKEPEEHTLVISSFRIRLFKKGKIASEYHMLDISEIQSSNKTEIVLLSKSTILKRITTDSSEKCDEILKILFILYTTSFPEADTDVIRFTVLPADRFDEILKRADCTDVGACGGFVSTYRAICNYLGVSPNAVVCWDIGHLFPYNNIVDFNLNEFYQLNMTELKPLIMALQYNHYFKNFFALHYKLGAEGLQQVTELLLKNTGIEKVDLQYTSAPKEALISLLNSLHTKKHSITHIDLSGNIMQTKALAALSEFLRNFDHDLKVLRVNNVSGTHRGMEVLLTALQGNPNLHNSLTQLAFSYNKLDLSTATYALSMLCARCTNLTSLEMRSTSPVWSLMKNGLPALTTLDISENKISVKDNSVDDVLSFLRGCTSLQNLHLTNCMLGNEEVKKLLIDGSPVMRISSLDLADNEFGDEGLITLCQKMYFNSNLRHLSIQGNFKNKTKYRVRALECITHLIEDNIAIESINISAGAGKSQFKSEILLFLMSLQNNQSLLKLDMRGHGIGDWGAVVLGQVIQGNTTLRTIKCGDNGFGLKGLRIIKNSLQRNTTIVEMPLPINDIAAVLKSDNSPTTQHKIQSYSRKIQKLLAVNLSNMARGIDGSSMYLSTPGSSAPGSPNGSSTNSPDTRDIKRASLKHVRSFSGSKEVALTLGLKQGTAASVSRWTAKDKDKDTPKPAAAPVENSNVPPLVSKCVAYLMEKGCESVGIFRVCASASVLKKLKTRLLAGEDIDMFNDINDPDIAAGLLKSYYREADEPLYPEATHLPFMAGFGQSPEVRVAKYIEAFKLLPAPTQTVSKMLFQLMFKISQLSEVNMMSPDNISICWAPTLFRSFATEFISIVVQIIEDYEYIFEGKTKVEAPPPAPEPEVVTPDETPDSTSPDFDDALPPPTPPSAHQVLSHHATMDENGDLVGTLSRHASWVNALDSPRSGGGAGPRLHSRRLSLKTTAQAISALGAQPHGPSPMNPNAHSAGDASPPTATGDPTPATPAHPPTLVRPTNRPHWVANQKYATIVFAQYATDEPPSS